jgi:hydroxymethylglutaryl-CoA reductase (NADPH)
MSTLSAINKNSTLSTEEKIHERQNYIIDTLKDTTVLQHDTALEAAASTENRTGIFTIPDGAADIAVKNCENLVGSVQIPVGVAGPLSMRARLVVERGKGESPQDSASDDILTLDQSFVPFAITEGALVASVNRGCRAVREAGGVSVMVRQLGITRAPVFLCASGEQAQALVAWFQTHSGLVAEWAESTSAYLKLKDVTGWVRGRYAFVRFRCTTGEAMGMNMISIAVQSVWMNLLAEIDRGAYPELRGVEMISLSSNVCSDKKAGTLNGVLGRGFWVQAELHVPAQVVTDVLKSGNDTVVANLDQ